MRAYPPEDGFDGMHHLKKVLLPALRWVKEGYLPGKAQTQVWNENEPLLEGLVEGFFYFATEVSEAKNVESTGLLRW